MTQEEEINLTARRDVLKNRTVKLVKNRCWPAKDILMQLLDACNVRHFTVIPLKVVPLAEQFIDRVVKDYGLPEV
jgi:hypothetical protein